MFGWELRGLSRGENLLFIETIPRHKEQFKFNYHSDFQCPQNLVASTQFRGLKRFHLRKTGRLWLEHLFNNFVGLSTLSLKLKQKGQTMLV